MRTAVFVLLFANLAFFAWSAWIDTPLPAPPSPAAKGLPRLVLAAQSPANAADGARADQRTDTGEPAAHAAGGARCLSVGPFDSQERADAALATLSGRGYEPRQRSLEGERWDGYWVYVANLQSDLEEARIMRTLMQAQLSDARIMPMSSQGRRISVGVFSERIRAERRAHVLQRLGIEAQIGERRSPGTVFWMDVDLKAGDSTIPTEGLQPADTPGSPLEVKACGATVG